MALGARAFDVLQALVERRERLVTKDELLDLVWPGLVVEENNLQQQVSALRKILGSDAIATIPGCGYRFTLEPTLEADVAPVWGAAKNNLPQQASSFIGREHELSEVKRLLTQSRLLTLVGIGGIGKTRLSLRLAADTLDAYPDGVWLVEFGAIVDPLLVPSSVAQALGVKERPGTQLTYALCAHLKSRRLLLVLDNCEHLVKACAELAGILLAAAPDIRILATSREPLHVQGEQRFPLPPLSLPAPDAALDGLARAEAVQLFVERAQLQQPAFVLTERQLPVVAELCAHLDGIPLALELAAARVHSLSIEEINARLKDRFKLLTGGSHTALPRQQTLRATLDWSYELLTDPERAVLNRLAIFLGGFTLDTALSVASDHTIDEHAVVDLLSHLVARSLVVADTNSAGTRYHLLETTRAYALEKLAAAGEHNDIGRRHALYFRQRFERALDDWRHIPEEEWCTAYLAERDNVRAALDWALGSGGDSAIGIALAGASSRVWVDSYLLSEGRRWLEAALAQVSAHTPESDQARLWLGLGWLWSHYTPTQAVSAFEQAIGLYRRAGDASGLTYCLIPLGGNLAFIGRYEQAQSALTEAFPLLERAGAPRALAQYFAVLGFLKMRTGDPGSARVHYEKALSLYDTAGVGSARLDILGNLADISWALGDLDAALAGFRETVTLLRKSPLITKVMLGIHLGNLAGVLIERGELDEALTVAREGLPMLKEWEYASIHLDHIALRAALVGKVANAARVAGFADSIFMAKEISRQPNEARARDRLQALLTEKLAAVELERLLGEGAKMTEDEACRLALEE